jgi:DNA repair exonuclease SbcCD nuclease subunit
MIKLYNQKVAIISDLHFGLHSNSDMWHKILIDYGTWLKQQLDAQGIRDLLVLGDIFNDREEIGVKTLFITEQFFKLFSDPNDIYNIVLLTGNHDSYFRDNSDINSISIFKGWNNVQVVDKLETLKHHNKTMAFAPWGYKPDDLVDNVDVLFGHFEINTFKKTPLKLCENGVNSDDLLNKASLVFSGHFHIRDERQYKNGNIVYVGCPFSQSWNDWNSSKGFYILDTANLSYTFTENTISPAYYKIRLSDFLIKSNIPNIKKLIPNNFIKIIVDTNIDYSQLEKVMSTLTLMKPLEVSSDFVQKEVKISESYESVHLDIGSLITEFITNLDITDIKDKVFKEMEEIYNKALTKVNIESV